MAIKKLIVPMLEHTPILLTEHILEELYSQKERARHFGQYINKLWQQIEDLPPAQIEQLEKKLGRERFKELLNSKKARRYVDRSENLALLDVVSPELKEGVYTNSKLTEKQNKFFERKRIETRAFMDLVRHPKSDLIVDIAGGAGDIGRSLALLTGKKALILDNNPHQIQYARELNKILGQKNIQVQYFDIRTQQIPDGTWVAKHPCGDLADQIIKQWSRANNSTELYLMTCCQGMAQEQAWHKSRTIHTAFPRKNGRSCAKSLI